MGGIARGGRNVYGVPVGVLMTESRFPRIVGDAGNALTWPFPVLYRVVPGAGPGRVVREGSERELLEPFCSAAVELERAGVELITTMCGFLVLFQEQIASRVGVPFLSSSLLQVPWIASLLPPSRRVGVLTIERASLTAEHLAAAGIRPEHGAAIVGMEEAGDHFRSAILGDELSLDVDVARAEHERAARLLVERHPDVGAVVLECTNMPPYAGAVQDATGLHVYDVTTLVTWGAAGRLPRPWSRPA